MLKSFIVCNIDIKMKNKKTTTNNKQNDVYSHIY